jgi:GNAT superfamily N-acetyltransferase
MGEVLAREVPFGSPEVQELLAEWDDELGFAPRHGGPGGLFLVAESGGAPVGCGGLRLLAPPVGEVKRLFVRKAARRRGVGRALLAALEDRAADMGLGELRLDTDGGERGALALFHAAGFEPIAHYNGNAHARHWFAKRLTI